MSADTLLSLSPEEALRNAFMAGNLRRYLELIPKCNLDTEVAYAGGKTSLMHLVLDSSHPESVHLAARIYPKLSFREFKTEVNLMTYFAREEDPEALKIVAARGGDVNYTDGKAPPPIITAAIIGSVPCVQMLADLGADVAILTGDRRNLLHWAFYDNRPEAIESILDIAMNYDPRLLNQKDAAGSTPLMQLAIGMSNDLYASGHAEESRGEWERLVDYLIDRGADLSIRNNEGLTVIQMADDFHPVANEIFEGASKRWNAKKNLSVYREKLQENVLDHPSRNRRTI